VFFQATTNPNWALERNSAFVTERVLWKLNISKDHVNL